MFWRHFLNYLVLVIFLGRTVSFQQEKNVWLSNCSMFDFLQQSFVYFGTLPLLLGKAGAGLDSEHFDFILRASEPRLAKMCAELGWVLNRFNMNVNHFVFYQICNLMELFSSLGTKFS